MWLKEVCPEMDTRNGSVQSFDFTQERPNFIEVYMGQDHPLGTLTIQVLGTHGLMTSEAPNLKLSECCEEIVQMVGLEKIVHGTIDFLRVWNGGDAVPVLCAELPHEAKVIIAISANGTGLIQVADANGIFCEPQNVDV